MKFLLALALLVSGASASEIFPPSSGGGSGSIGPAGPAGGTKTLSITISGGMVYPYRMGLLGAEAVISSGVSGTFNITNSTGVGIDRFDYTESGIVSTGLISLAFNDLEWVQGSFLPVSVSSLATLSLPALRSVGGAFSPTGASLANVNVPSLVFVGGAFAPSIPGTLSTGSYPSLSVVQGAFTAGMLMSGTTESYPALTFVGSGGITPAAVPLRTVWSAPQLAKVAGTFAMNNFGPVNTVNVPVLQEIGGALSMSMNRTETFTFPSLTTTGGIASATNKIGGLSFPVLSTCTGAFALQGTSLTILSMPSLGLVNSTLFFGTLPLISTISLPSLYRWNGTTTIDSITNLSRLNLPAISSGTGSFSAASNTQLSSVTFGTIGTMKYLSTTVSFSGDALTQASVDNIICNLASLDGTNGTTVWKSTVTLTGGTNSTPSATGLACKAAMLVTGGVVNNN